MPRGDGPAPLPIDWQAAAQIAMQQRDAALKLAADREIDLLLMQARLRQLLAQLSEPQVVEPT